MRSALILGISDEGANDAGERGRPRSRRYLPLAAVGILLGCAQLGPGGGPEDPVAERWTERGFQARWRGDDAAAEAFWAAAVARDAWHVEAERQLQNLAIERSQRGRAVERAARLLREAPEQAAAHYLYGRLQSDLSVQKAWFEEALAIGPDSPWPCLGLGHLALATGDLGDAIGWFERGLDVAPDHRSLRLGLAQAQLIAQQPDAARALLDDDDPGFDPSDERWLHLRTEVSRLEEPNGRAAIRRLGRALVRHPRNSRHAQRLLGLVAAGGTTEDARWLMHLLSGVVDDGTDDLHRLFAAVAEASGAADRALAGLAKLPSLTHDEHEGRRRLLVRLGRVEEALSHEVPLSRAMTALGHPPERLQQAMDAWARGDVRATAEAFRALGWLDEAVSLLRADEVHQSGGGDAADLLRDVQGQMRLESELEVLARGVYRTFDADGDVPPFDDYLDLLGELTTDALGRDLVQDSPVLRVAPLGAMLDPDPEGGGAWASYFARRGRLAVVGRRAFHPPETMLLDVVATGRAGPQDAYLAFAVGDRIPSYLHERGARISGAALHRFVYVDVGFLRQDVGALQARLKRLRESPRRVLDDPPMPAKTAEARCSLDEPGEVTRKLEWRADEEARARHPALGDAALLHDAIDEVLKHETLHLVDEADFLSSSVPWLRAVGILVQQGFSPARIEGWLEMRAQCAALVVADNPYLALASCTDYLPTSRVGDSPHARGYHDLLEAFVADLEAHLDDFPALSREAVLVQQLDRLTPDEIRRVARRVADRFDVPTLPR